MEMYYKEMRNRLFIDSISEKIHKHKIFREI